MQVKMLPWAPPSWWRAATNLRWSSGDQHRRALRRACCWDWRDTWLLTGADTWHLAIAFEAEQTAERWSSRTAATGPETRGRSGNLPVTLSSLLEAEEMAEMHLNGTNAPPKLLLFDSRDGVSLARRWSDSSPLYNQNLQKKLITHSKGEN